jgi:hypothetical protein
METPFKENKIATQLPATHTTSSAGPLYQISDEWVYEIRRSTIQNSKKNLLEAGFIDDARRRAVSRKTVLAGADFSFQVCAAKAAVLQASLP